MSYAKQLDDWGVPSQTAKANNKEKQGNKNRSVSLVGFGGGTYSNAGFIILDPPVSSLSQIYKENATTGRDKKNELNTKQSIVSDSEKQEQLSKIHNKLKQGGVYSFGHHTEIICDLTHFDGIYFNQDRCLGNGLFNGNRSSQHQHSGYLQAIYLQQEYFKTHHILLPIVHYSRFQHAIPLQKTLTDPELILMWEKMCADYISSELDQGRFDVLQKSSDEIKIASMYGPIDPMSLAQLKIKTILPGDSNYEKSLQNTISARIEQLKVSIKKSHEDHTRNTLHSGHTSVLLDGVYSYLIIDQSMRLEFKDNIVSELNKAIQNIVEVSAICDLLNKGKTKKQLERIYKLAQLLQVAELVTKIEDYVTIAAKNIIDRMKDTPCKENIAIETDRVYSLVEHYNCFENCQQEFIELVRYGMEKNSTTNTIHNRHNQWWKITHRLIECLYKIKKPTLLSTLESDIQIVIRQYHQVFKQFVVPVSRPYYSYEEATLRTLLEYYLNIAKLTKLSAARQKEAVLDFFSQCRVHHNFFTPENSRATLKSLREAGLLNDNEVFQEVIHHFDLSVHALDEGKPTEIFDPFEVQSRLHAILANIPEGQLTRSQRRIVTRKFVGLIKDKGNSFIKFLDADLPPPLIMTEELEAAIRDNHLKEKIENPSTPDYFLNSCLLFQSTGKKIEGEQVLMDELLILNKDFSIEQFETLVNQSSAEALILLLSYLNTPQPSSPILQKFISIIGSDAELLPKLKKRAGSQLITQAKRENLNIKNDYEVQHILKLNNREHAVTFFFEHPTRTSTGSDCSQAQMVRPLQ